MPSLVRVARPQLGDEEIRAVEDVLRSGNFIQGRRVREFEEAFAEYTGKPHCVAVSSGTAALHLSLLANGIGPEYEVIVPPITFFATVEAVLWCGATPVFVDVCESNHVLDPLLVEDQMRQRLVEAVIPVHLYGGAAYPWDHQELSFVLEDAAQAHGNPSVGYGDAQCYSFMATKNMTTIEGGAITTDDEGLAREVRRLRNHGMESDRHTHHSLGHNFRMNEIEAAVGLAQLPKLDGMNYERRLRAKRVMDELKGVTWLSFPVTDPGHVFFYLPALVDEDTLGLTTDQLVGRLRNAGVEVRHRYFQPLYRQAPCREYAPEEPLPVAESIAGRVIGLPCRPDMEDWEVEKVVEAISCY